MLPVVVVLQVIQEPSLVQILAHTELRVLVVPPVLGVSVVRAIMVVTRLVALVPHQDLVVVADPPTAAWAVMVPLVSPFSAVLSEQVVVH